MIETEIVTTTTYESIGAVTGLPDTLDKGQSAVITAELTTTNPYGDINFSIFNPLGFDDVFNIGYPQIASLGTSYECNNVSKWVPTMQKSISGLSVGKVDFDLTAVINVDMTRNISNEENKMVIKFPITAMKGFTEGQYAFTVAMKVGTEDVITVTQDITITDTEHSPTISSGDITLGTPTSLKSSLNARWLLRSVSRLFTSTQPNSVAKTWEQVKFRMDFPALLDANIVSVNMSVSKWQYRSILSLYS